MNPSILQPPALRIAYRVYAALFLVYLALPLVVVAVFAFHDSLFPALPWTGFAWNWFFATKLPVIGVFHECSILRAPNNSVPAAARCVACHGSPRACHRA